MKKCRKNKGNNGGEGGGGEKKIIAPLKIKSKK
jgi:hypothetical protein